ncbi:hypothetical protein I302_102495 [Kwoniella bestiolae CBS 10118]|uniref:Type I phosphodiesterase/nucleotide pyrophosphatase n=1 Tax=Kwoniella bestiolae CBS 10118 TaxID=1296100 RepID=A0A1B9GF48_9TREE|nr:hypothetical protein I302_01186 [Kwoniella bestiolae CBS 10118]OCF29674.1 hypothetical protein I302_01186 [Kwoniella bestiolae CBS 10118]
MNTYPKLKAKGKQKTPTPLVEQGGGSRRSSVSSSEDDLVVHHQDDIDTEQYSEDVGDYRGDELANLPGEREGLLGEQNVKRNLKPLIVDDGKRKQGRVKILGVELPKPLLYLLSIPPILLLFSFLTHRPSLYHPIPTLSNGTHTYHPTVLLISLDGFRPSYLTSHSNLLPNILNLARMDDGIRAESMRPVFPTLTFPNHWSIMTGLHPESHGIVANNFWDPLFGGVIAKEIREDGGDEADIQIRDDRDIDGLDIGIIDETPDMRSGNLIDSIEDETTTDTKTKKDEKNTGAQFVYTEEDKSWDSNWWWGEPIWSFVERMKMKSAVIMWPGPPVTSHGIAPSYFVPYRKLSPSKKVTQILSYLDLPLSDRPQFIASYFPEIDQSGHRGGPDSKGVNDSIALCDGMIGELLEGLRQRNLDGIVNVVIVSDHGMAETSNDRIIYLDDILGEEGVDAIEHKDGWPSVGLRFKEGVDSENYLNILLEAAESSNGTFAVYTHETMPERWHFNHGHRIAPIYVVPTIGWAITDHHEHEVMFQGDYQPKGNHGYDNLFPEMQAIFFGKGPFVMLIKERASAEVYETVEPAILKSFPNLELFSLVTRLLGLSREDEPAHNGTIGFWDRYLGS